MALIHDSRFRAFDSNGDPLAGATLTIYDAGTFTAASVYRDPDLTDPMTNPTTAPDTSDAGGWFPQVFMAEGSLVDITMKTSGGSTLKQWESVAALGDGSSAIERDFGTARLRIDADGSTVRFEGGPAEGDDVGGAVSVGGYGGSQADTLELDAAEASTTGDFDVGGTLTENGQDLGGVVVGTGTVSAASQIIVPLTVSPSGVRAWEVDIAGLVTGGDLRMQISVDGGATYLSAASYYGHYTYLSGGAAAIGSTSAASQMNVMAGPAISGSALGLRVISPASGTGRTCWSGVGTYNTGGNVGPVTTAGAYNVDVAAATHIRLYPSAGTITGKWRCVALRGL